MKGPFLIRIFHNLQITIFISLFYFVLVPQIRTILINTSQMFSFYEHTT